MPAEGKFTARKIDNVTWKLDVIHSGLLAGKKSTMIVRKQGDYVLVKEDVELAHEFKYKRK